MMRRSSTSAGPRGRRRDGRKFHPRKKVCGFCVEGIHIIDYKDVPRLRRYISVFANIEPRRKTGTCAPHQRALGMAIKRARYVALLPYTGDHSLIEIGPPDRGRGGDRRFDRRGRPDQFPRAPEEQRPSSAGEQPAAVPDHVAAVAVAEPETEAAPAAEQAEAPTAESVSEAELAVVEPEVEAAPVAEQAEAPTAESVSEAELAAVEPEVEAAPVVEQAEAPTAESVSEAELAAVEPEVETVPATEQAAPVEEAPSEEASDKA
jgi:small subunit ribosomal protein S18